MSSYERRFFRFDVRAREDAQLAKIALPPPPHRGRSEPRGALSTVGAKTRPLSPFNRLRSCSQHPELLSFLGSISFFREAGLGFLPRSLNSLSPRDNLARRLLRLASAFPAASLCLTPPPLLAARCMVYFVDPVECCTAKGEISVGFNSRTSSIGRGR